MAQIIKKQPERQTHGQTYCVALSQNGAHTNGLISVALSKNCLTAKMGHIFTLISVVLCQNYITAKMVDKLTSSVLL